MKSKHFVFSGVVVCIAALSLGISVTVRRMHAGGVTQVSPRAVPWVPYQISYKTYAKNANLPQAKIIEERMRAVRSDGASVESLVNYTLDGSIHGQQRLLNLPGGVRILAKERLGLMTATRDAKEDDAHSRQRLDPSQSCVITLDGGQMAQNPIVTREILLGHETYKIVVDMKQYRNTYWHAPALGCAELRMLAEKIDLQSGQVTNTSDRTAVEIRPGEPDPALFELPRGLRNISPSELAVAARKANLKDTKASLKDTEVAAFQPWDEHFRQFRFDW